MSTKTFKKGVLASSIAMILAGVTSQAMAAEEAASEINKDEVEVIQVTGIRGSLKASLNAKRFSNAVMDRYLQKILVSSLTAMLVNH